MSNQDEQEQIIKNVSQSIGLSEKEVRSFLTELGMTVVIGMYKENEGVKVLASIRDIIRKNRRFKVISDNIVARYKKGI